MPTSKLSWGQSRQHALDRIWVTVGSGKVEEQADSILWIAILRREDTVETYYNAAPTHWLSLTADLQIIDPGLKKTLNPPPGLPA